MDIDIKPPFELDREAWKRLKSAFWRFLITLAGLAALAVGLAYLLDGLVRLFGGYEGSL